MGDTFQIRKWRNNIFEEAQKMVSPETTSERIPAPGLNCLDIGIVEMNE
jgi:hypothetical protein